MRCHLPHIVGLVCQPFCRPFLPKNSSAASTMSEPEGESIELDCMCCDMHTPKYGLCANFHRLRDMPHIYQIYVSLIYQISLSACEWLFLCSRWPPKLTIFLKKKTKHWRVVVAGSRNLFYSWVAYQSGLSDAIKQSDTLTSGRSGNQNNNLETRRIHNRGVYERASPK